MFKTLILIFAAIHTVLSDSATCIPTEYCKNSSIPIDPSLCDLECDKKEVCCNNKNIQRGKELEYLGCGRNKLMGTFKALRTTEFYKQSGNGSYPGLSPWFMQVGINGTNHFHCNGALIKPNVVLTIASCVSIKYVNYTVRGGLPEVFGKSDDKDKHVAKVVLHNHYNISNSNIAVLILKDPFELSLDIQPVCVPAQSDLSKYSSLSGSDMYESVWHQFIFKNKMTFGELFTVLVRQRVQMSTQSSCNRKFNKKSLSTSDKFCSYWSKSKSKSCIKERYLGSPIVRENKDNDGRYELVGLSVLDDKIGCDNYHRIYTFVPSFRDFISLTILSNKNVK